MQELVIKIKYHGDTPPIEKIEVGDWIDLRAAEDVTLKAGQWRPISLGISMEFVNFVCCISFSHYRDINLILWRSTMKKVAIFLLTG